MLVTVNSTEIVSDLAAGDYTIDAVTFTPEFCFASTTVTVTGVGACDEQGGDSDGDGICDNQDNCDFTSNPDQADNDGDGIGNVCDDTPNGVSCTSIDTDGDGICDANDLDDDNDGI